MLTAALLREQAPQVKTLLLVSSDYHLPLGCLLFEEKALPALPFPIVRISYLDGVKVYFENEGWIIARFSGTEPVLRIFCEMPEREDACRLCGIFEEFLGL